MVLWFESCLWNWSVISRNSGARVGLKISNMGERLSDKLRVKYLKLTRSAEINSSAYGPHHSDEYKSGPFVFGHCMLFDDESWLMASSRHVRIFILRECKLERGVQLANLASVVAINNCWFTHYSSPHPPKQGLWSRSLHPHKDFKLTRINNYFEQKKKGQVLWNLVWQGRKMWCYFFKNQR